MQFLQVCFSLVSLKSSLPLFQVNSSKNLYLIPYFKPQRILVIRPGMYIHRSRRIAGEHDIIPAILIYSWRGLSELLSEGGGG
jgi:hypothetical protein